MSKLSVEQLEKARQAAQEVIDMLAGRWSDRLSIDHWDFLNDVAAPPAVVKAMADEILNLRRLNAAQHKQRIIDRTRFANVTSATAGMATEELFKQYFLGEFKHEPEGTEEPGRVERPYSQPATHAYGKPIK